MRSPVKLGCALGQTWRDDHQQRRSTLHRPFIVAGFGQRPVPGSGRWWGSGTRPGCEDQTGPVTGYRSGRYACGEQQVGLISTHNTRRGAGALLPPSRIPYPAVHQGPRGGPTVGHGMCTIHHDVVIPLCGCWFDVTRGLRR